MSLFPPSHTSMTAGIPASSDPTLSRITRAVEMVETATNLLRRGRNWYRARTTYAIRITSDDGALYRDALAAVVADLPETSQRALRAYVTREPGSRSTSPWDDEVAAPSGGHAQPRMRLRYIYDARYREATVTIAGHPIRVAIETPDTSPPEGPRMKMVQDTLRLEARDLDGLRALQDWLAEIIQVANRRELNPQVWSVGSYGDWRSMPGLPWRTLDSVVLTAGQRERIVADLEEFLRREATYVRNGWPWHRGYLLYGPPGTGKSSLVKGLAHYLGLDLFCMSLSDLKQDANLLGLIGEVNPRSILLIEDIDAFHAATRRESEGNEVTISGLLNAIDGVATPHGLITVFTTNHPEELDAALTRPGRVDLREEIGLPDDEQATRLFQVVYGHAPRTRWSVPCGATTADLMEIFKQHIDDPDGAEREIGRRLPVDTPPAVTAIATHLTSSDRVTSVPFP